MAELKCVQAAFPKALQSTSNFLSSLLCTNAHLVQKSSSGRTITAPPKLQHTNTKKKTATKQEYPSDFFLPKVAAPLDVIELPVTESALIDRSWLEMETTASAKRYQTYVPQVDDILVYYPMGHKAFLDQFLHIRKKIALQHKSSRHSKSAVDEDEEYGYLNLFEQRGYNGAAGIVCIVKETHAEFPSQDYSKVDNKATPFLIYNRQKNVPMALSIALKPIADPLGHFVDEKSSLPPFTFQLFPTMFSYCIPIHWALDASSVSVNDQVKHRLWKSKGKVQSISNGVRLESNTSLHSYRFKDCSCMVENMAVTLNSNAIGEEPNQSVPLDHFVLPNWNGVNVEWDDGSSRNVSAWEIAVAQSASLDKNDDRPSRRSLLSSNYRHRTVSANTWLQCAMSEDIRSGIEDALNKIIQTYDGIEVFLDEVTDTVAPSYSCIVPLPMCFRKVLKRLKVTGDDCNRGCYYHGFLSVASDLRAIYSNCRLYNYDDSEITKLCHRIATEALNSIVSVRQDILEQRARLPRSESLCGIEQNKRSFVDKRWLGGFTPDSSWQNRDEKSTTARNQLFWVPQVGDNIIYDKVLHETFISHHKLVGTPENACVDSFTHQITVNNDQLSGKIINIQPLVFPDDDIRNRSFQRPASVLHVTMEFASEEGGSHREPFSALWRPCILGKSTETACSCGHSSSSFISPSWLTSESVQPQGIDQATRDSIINCLETLRYRCSIGLSSDKISDEISAHYQFFSNEGEDLSYWASNQGDLFLPTKIAGHLPDAKQMLDCFSAAPKLTARSPSPQLSIDLVISRLRYQFYRHLSAAESDIQAAFSMISAQLLEKSSENSIGAGPSRNGKIITSPPRVPKQNKTPEHMYDLLLKIYSTALLCISKPKLCNMAFGFVCRKMLLERLGPLKERANQLDRIIAALVDDPRKNHRKISNGEPYPAFSIRVRLLDDTTPDNGVSSPSSETSKIDRTVITIDPSIYQSEEKLAIALFGKPQRRCPCTRCFLLSRNFLECRVRRGHSNPSLSMDEIKVENGLSHLFNTEIKADEDTNAIDAPDDGNEQLEKKDKEEMLEKAKLAHKLALDAMTVARALHDSPLELTNEFVKVNFPVDPTDGHYLFCIVCGYGGDMLVCEGCPVVAHADCCSLCSIPQGDWYCNLCSSKPSGKEDLCNEEVHSHVENSDSIDQSSSAITSLETLLDELKSYRLSKMFPTNAGLHETGNNAICNEDDSVPPNRETSEQPNNYSKGPRVIEYATEMQRATLNTEEGADTTEQPAFKRPRGRPRKNSSYSPLSGAPVEKVFANVNDEQPVKRARGRPRKTDGDSEKELQTRAPTLVESSKLAEQLTKKRGRPPKISITSPFNSISREESVLEKACPGEIVKKGGKLIYVARENDQISTIAVMFGTSVEKVIALNMNDYPSLKRHSRLKALTRIRLPKGARQIMNSTEKPATSTFRKLKKGRPLKGDDAKETSTEKLLEDDFAEDSKETATSLTVQNSITDRAPQPFSQKSLIKGNAEQSLAKFDPFGLDNDDRSSVSIYDDCIDSFVAIQGVTQGMGTSKDKNQLEVLVELPSNAVANKEISIQLQPAEYPNALQITCPPYPFARNGLTNRLVRVRLPRK
mmetsp:Transcript_20471/g.29188  ORF Transcript_20471/g.29188 Transcript_20471/m.29188 type:complete len:1615 (-) Transcript_20471:1224-6068(-)